MNKYLAHSNELELSIALAPKINGLPENAKIIFFGQDHLRHANHPGDYYAIIKIYGDLRVFYGQPEKLHEEINADNRAPKSHDKRHYTVDGKSFIYFEREPHRSTILGRSLKIYHTQKNPE